MRPANIELIYDADCPNVAAARNQLARATQTLGFEPSWKEWERSEFGAPEYVRQYGSPTILVNGQDVAKGDNPDAGCCRIYIRNSGALRGVPSTEQIETSLRWALNENTSNVTKL